MSAAEQWKKLLVSEEIDLPTLRGLVAAGLADDRRAIAWQVLLRVMPTQPSLWGAVSRTHLDTYKDFVRELVGKRPILDPRTLSAAAGTLLHEVVVRESSAALSMAEDSQSPEVEQSRRAAEEALAALTSTGDDDSLFQSSRTRNTTAASGSASVAPTGSSGSRGASATASGGGAAKSALFADSDDEDGEGKQADKRATATVTVASAGGSADAAATTSPLEKLEEALSVSSRPLGGASITSGGASGLFDDSDDEDRVQRAKRSLAAKQATASSANMLSSASGTPVLSAAPSPAPTAAALSASATSSSSPSGVGGDDGASPAGIGATSSGSPAGTPSGFDPLRGGMSDADAAAREDDEMLREDVRKDVIRTNNTIAFFQSTAVLEAMARILYVYGKLNPGIRYVQGMNELLAPIFYVCSTAPLPHEVGKGISAHATGPVSAATDGTTAAGSSTSEPGATAAKAGDASSAPSDDDMPDATAPPPAARSVAPFLAATLLNAADIATPAEAAAFFTFTALMAETRDVFQKNLDDSSSGLQGVISTFGACMIRLDSVLWRHLDGCGVDPRFYGVRWFTTLLAREFSLPDTLRLWDCLIADENRFSLLFYTAAAMIHVYRDTLLRGDFMVCLRLLQSFPPDADLERIISVARRMRDVDLLQPGVHLVSGVPHGPGEDAVKSRLRTSGIASRAAVTRIAGNASAAARRTVSSWAKRLGSALSIPGEDSPDPLGVDGSEDASTGTVAVRVSTILGVSAEVARSAVTTSPASHPKHEGSPQTDAKDKAATARAARQAREADDDAGADEEAGDSSRGPTVDGELTGFSGASV